MSRRPLPRGLRARLIVAFALVTMLGAGAASWASAESASDALVDSSQRRLTEDFAERIGAIAPTLTYPPDQETLDRLRAAVGPNTTVTYEDLRSSEGPHADLITDELLDAVGDGDRIATQRITDDGPWLLIGAPVMITAPDGTRTPSGIEVYAVRDLAEVHRQIAALASSAIGTAGAALPLSVLVALIAARSVLRPVRELRDTARRLADGDLDARTPPLGADELAQLAVTVNEMAESVQGSMAAMGRMQADARRFAADVSHELRTPLTTLTAVAEVLEDASGGMEADAAESARLAITEIHRLVRLVEDLMEVSRFDAGTVHPRLEEVDLAEAVRDSLRARGWLDRVETTGPETIRLRADRRRLDVIIANLVGNALRHGAPPVRIDLSASETHVRIEVTDHGPGLSDQALPHVFDRFYKADNARTRTPGSGLGLAIALENARLHGGDLTAGNADGGGAAFILRLPIGSEEP
ncbi:HAMP domain-containing sensor histidine kinase [Glycomyces sp. NRRL B-16210]|uniref:sensor histidine kinase n=1 Tax=Glycomyces sp. NRRL B-16210 TaxID=1463821 RepID=UPI0004BF1E45|nr:HAMP domain-containing sensor histidine kinase [Glycomyces sp. NRRL B-16210]